MINFSLTFLWVGACKRNDQVSKQQQASYRSIPAFQSMLRMGPFGSGLTLPSGKLHRGGPVLNFQTCFYSMYLSQTRPHTQFLECFVPLSPICVKFNKCNILWSAHTHICNNEHKLSHKHTHTGSIPCGHSCIEHFLTRPYFLPLSQYFSTNIWLTIALCLNPDASHPSPSLRFPPLLQTQFEKFIWS